MILVHRQPFGVSEFHVRQRPDTAGTALARGPVVRVTPRFEQWLGGRVIEADAFVDPGADDTVLSMRWVEEHAGRGRHAQPIFSTPDPRDLAYRLLEEEAFVQMGGCELALTTGSPVRLMAQPPMAGFEDVLLGRDFLAAHQLLVIFDGQDETVSILHPADDDSRRRRDRVLDALARPTATLSPPTVSVWERLRTNPYNETDAPASAGDPSASRDRGR